MFSQDDVIYTYTRKQALKDGEQVSADSIVFGLARQHYKYPVFLTRAVLETIRAAVENKKHCNDYAGVLHDILWMSRRAGCRLDPQTVRFQVIITGTGRRKYHTMIAQCGPMDFDDPSPVVTIMFPEEM